MNNIDLNILNDYKNFVDMKDIRSKYNVNQKYIRHVVENTGLKYSNRLYRYLSFPMNIIHDIFGCIDFSVDKDNIRGLEFCMNKLSQIERNVLNMYYKDEFTIKDISIKCGLSYDKTRGLFEKAMNRLRHPSNASFIKYGYTSYMTMMKESKIRDIYEKSENDRRLRSKDLGDIEIMDLGISNRLKNVLKRNGIHVISDIKSEKHVGNMRGMGKQSFNELIQTMKEIGYTIPN